MKKEPKMAFTISMTPTMKAAANKLAEKQQRNLSQYIQVLLQKAIDEEKNER